MRKFTTKWLLSLLIIVGVAWQSYGQISAYTFTSSAGTYTPITGGTVLWSATFDEDISAAITIPTFNFNATNFTTLYVTANGFITFGSAPAGTNYTAISNTASYSGAIAAFSRDLNQATTGTPEIRYEQVGDEFVVQFQDIRRYNVANERLSAQIRLNTVTNAIVIVYGGTIVGGANTTYPQVGIRGASNTVYKNRTTTTDWSATTAGATNSSTCLINATIFPSVGLTYTFTPPACPAPSALTATNITTTDADLGWTNNSGATVFDIELGLTGFTPTGTPTFNDVSNPYHGTGGSPATTYQYYVRADCGANNTDVSTWSGPFSFTTACNVINTFPWTESFTSTTKPACWALSHTGTTTYDWTFVNADATNGAATGFGGAGYFARLHSFLAPIANNNYIITTPEFDLSSGNKQLVYQAWIGSASSANPIIVKVSTDNQANWTTLKTHDHSTVSAWFENIIDLSAYNTSSVYIRFEGVSNYGSGQCNFAIDEVIIRDIPSCQAPTALAANNITATSADLAWTESGTASTWDIEYGVTGFTPTGTASNENVGNPFVLNSLTQSTTYQYYVRADCSGDNTLTSTWSGPFSFTTPASCPAPTVLTATSITSSSADLGWTNNSSATVFDIELGLTGFTPSGTPTSNDVSNPFTVNSLTASSAYQYYVRADCGADNTDVSAWAGPFSFTTACGAINTFPWTEGFESATTPNMTNCWLVENGNWVTALNSSSTYDADAHTGAQFLRDAWTATDEYVWTPGFELTAGTSYDFSFWWAGDGYADWTGDIFYNTIQNSTGVTQLGTSFIEAATTTTTTYAQVTNSFIPSSTGIYYFAIRVNELTGDPWYLSFDDFSLNYTPSCPAPSVLTATNITTTSADLGWTESGTASIWDIAVGSTGFTPGTPTNENVSNSFTLSGLTASTAYQYYVRADCSGDNSSVSTWSGPFTITTACEVYTTFPYLEDFEGTFLPACWSKNLPGGTSPNNITQSSTVNHTASGQYSARFSSFSSSSNYNQYLTSPTFTIDGTHTEFSFWHNKSNAAADELEYGIVTSSDTTWTTVTLEQGVWNKTVADISAYTGQDISFLFHYYGDFLYYVYIDDISIAEPLSADAEILTYSIPTQLSSAIVAADDSISVVMPNGTDVSALVAEFTLSTAASAAVGANAQVSTTTANDWTTNPVVYTVTAEDGTTRDWSVWVTVQPALSSDAEILTYSIPTQVSSAIVAADDSISVVMPNGTDVSALVAEFTLSTAASAAVGATAQVSTTTANDWTTNPVVYTVTAEDGTTRDWSVWVTVQPALSSDAEILTYSIPTQVSSAIVAADDSIAVVMPIGTDVSALVAEFTLSTAASAAVGATAQVSTVTANDWTTNPVVYTVTAEDGSTRNWSVWVTVETGINQIGKVNFKVYPNPSNGMFNVVSNLTASQIDILNAQGQLVRSVKVNQNENQVDLSSQAAGIYYIKVYQANEISIAKVNLIK